MKAKEMKVKARYIIYRNKENGFTVFDSKILESDVECSRRKAVVVGHFLSINEGDILIVKGEWKDTDRGWQFLSDAYEVVLPVTVDAMVDYLKRTVRGIGTKKSQAIVDYFKEDTMDIIKEDWKRLLEVPGIGEKTAEKIYKDVVSNKEFEKLMMYLLPMGVKHTDAVKIFDYYGSKAINIIRANPYSLLGIKRLSFRTLDGIAAKSGFEHNDIARIKAGVEYYIRLKMQNQGDLYVGKEEILANLSEFLRRLGVESFGWDKVIDKDLIEKALESMISENKLILEMNSQNKECVYISYYNYVENSIVNRISAMIEENTKAQLFSVDKIFEAIDSYEKTIGFKLADMQKQAVIMALTNKISILSGGPGTGKTQTTNAIIYCYKYLEPDISIRLAAPTGRAAKRMTELTNMPAETIHRLIGLREFYEGNSELINIEDDVLIIDEASMIDAYIFHNLLDCLSPFTRLVIVGDHEQLPSVGPGLILRDLIDSKKVATTTLTEIFRQAEGSKIILNSKRVIIGEKSAIEFDNHKDGEFFFISRSNEQKIKAGILQSIKNLINNQNYSLNDIQVLSVMNKGPLGTVELNNLIQSTFNYSLESTKVGQRIFKKNDRVMHIENNYDYDVFNGEVGVITKVIDAVSNDDKEIWVDFGDKTICYTGEMLSEIVLAYATTVHKSQGCEYPVVIMPFHRSLEILINKNMINTAWTRAKEKVICIGDINEMYKGIDREGNMIRNSLVKEKLQA